jgi:enoyl-CoA hydratase
MGAVELEARGPLRIVRVVRPEARNAFDLAMLRSLTRIARSLRRDPDARVVMLTGSHGFFAAGGDLRAFANVRTAAGARRLAAYGYEVVDAFHAIGAPFVAGLNGDAYGGGCELAAACDYRIMAASAKLHWVQQRFAVTTAWGGTSRLVHECGVGVATRWLLTAAGVTAQEAHAAGFAHEIVADAEAVEARALALAERIAEIPRAATKRQVELLRDIPGRTAADARDLEGRAFGSGWASKAHHDAVAKFLSRAR